MKNINARHLVCGMMLAAMIGMWLGFGVSSTANFPEEALELISLFSLAVVVMFIPVLKLRWRLVLLMPIGILALSVFAISMSVGVTFKNVTGTRVNISCVEISSHQIRRLALPPKQSRKLILCRGDSPAGFGDKAFATLASDEEGNIYFQGTIRVADVEKQKIIVLGEKDTVH
jgi:hypothetical protein